MLIECVEQAVTEAPKKEQNCYESNRVDGFAQRQFGRLGKPVIAYSEGSFPPEALGSHDGKEGSDPRPLLFLGV